MKTLEEALRDYCSGKPDRLWLLNTRDLSRDIRSNPDFDKLLASCFSYLKVSPEDPRAQEIETALASMFQAGIVIGSEMEKADFRDVK